MFSSALKALSSNISSNYTIEPTPSSLSGPWKIYDAKKKSTGKAVSIFVFERKSLESNGGGLARSNASALKKAQEEVVERLKKEASSLARLRHPSILEIVEPVEETRNGLQFATEAVTASLAGLLQDKDEGERSKGVGGRPSRYARDDGSGGRRRREIEIDELEIQKGLLQVSKALEFLHENAGLVHGNLTPDAIFINAKSDWKLSGLSFASPPDNSSKATSITPISLGEVLNIDNRLPRLVQLNLDYTSPDFVLDSNLNPSADMFSLGLLMIALYNSPHTSPLETNGSVSTYKKLFASPSTVPSAGNNWNSSRPLPKDLTALVLPRLITRRPAQRMTATEFQQSEYFNNILVSTIRFMDGIAAKTPNEKSQFMRGLQRVLPSFPRLTLEKKVLPALLEEMKDHTLLSLILVNVFSIVKTLPSGKRSFTEKVMPRLREVFIVGNGQKATVERDTAKEAGLMVVLQNMTTIAENCSGKEFKDDILPIIFLAIESPTHSMVDNAMRTLPVILPILDFSTIKNELFPVISTVFSRTSSLGIKVRGLEAFVILCGGSLDSQPSDDELSGIVATNTKKTTGSNALDKYTMQEKIVPLIKGIKTKEPAVMVAALNVLKQVGGIADRDFVATDILPILWTQALGPLLNLDQFKSFMELIRTLSSRVEQEHTNALQELMGSNRGSKSNGNDDFMSFEGAAGFAPPNGAADNTEDDFERLVKGNTGSAPLSANAVDSGWANAVVRQQSQTASIPSQQPVKFSWSTPNPSTPITPMTMTLKPQNGQTSRTITPDLSRFDALTPSTTQFSQALQPSSHPMVSPPIQSRMQSGAVNWGAAAHNPWGSSSSNSSTVAPNPWGGATSPPLSTLGSVGNSMGNMSLNSNAHSNSMGMGMGMGMQSTNTNTNITSRPLTNTNTNTNSFSSFSLPPPPSSSTSQIQTQSSYQRPMQQQQEFSLPPVGQQQQRQGGFVAPGSTGGFGGQVNMNSNMNSNAQQKSGLDKFESLL